MPPEVGQIALDQREYTSSKSIHSDLTSFPEPARSCGLIFGKPFLDLRL